MSYREKVVEANEKRFDARFNGGDFEAAQENYFKVVEEQIIEDRENGRGSDWIDLELPIDYITDAIADEKHRDIFTIEDIKEAYADYKRLVLICEKYAIRAGDEDFEFSTEMFLENYK